MKSDEAPRNGDSQKIADIEFLDTGGTLIMKLPNGERFATSMRGAKALEYFRNKIVAYLNESPSNQECNNCKGRGTIPAPSNQGLKGQRDYTCHICFGKGYCPKKNNTKECVCVSNNQYCGPMCINQSNRPKKEERCTCLCGGKKLGNGPRADIVCPCCDSNDCPLHGEPSLKIGYPCNGHGKDCTVNHDHKTGEPKLPSTLIRRKAEKTQYGTGKLPSCDVVYTVQAILDYLDSQHEADK